MFPLEKRSAQQSLRFLTFTIKSSLFVFVFKLPAVSLSDTNACCRTIFTKMQSFPRLIRCIRGGQRRFLKKLFSSLIPVDTLSARNTV